MEERRARARRRRGARPDAPRLLELGLIDRIIEEPLGGAHRDPAATARNVRIALAETLAELEPIPTAQRVDLRYARLRKLGAFAGE